MSDSRRTKVARERSEREAERARDPAAYRAKIELQRLRDLLAEPFWTAAQAAHIFAGLHPGDAEWGMTTFLPGGRDAYPNDEVRENRIDDSLSYLRGLFGGGAARSPADWMRRAEIFEFNPPWLSVAREDAECAAQLPKKRKDGTRAPAKRRGQAGGEAKGERAATNDAKLATAEEFQKRFPDGAIPHGQEKNFVSDMFAIFEARGFEAPVRGTVYNWVAEQKKKKQIHRA